MKVRPVVADRVPRPTILAAVADAYAVRVWDEQAQPRYEPGDTLYVNPVLPLRQGGAVVLYSGALDQERDMIIRRLVGQTDDTWLVQQYGADATLALLKSEWPVAHRIIGAIEA